MSELLSTELRMLDELFKLKNFQIYEGIKNAHEKKSFSYSHFFRSISDLSTMIHQKDHLFRYEKFEKELDSLKAHMEHIRSRLNGS